LKELLSSASTIKFAKKAKTANREYERCNNKDFDNGVYHKFVYKNQPQLLRNSEHGSACELAEEREIAQRCFEKMYSELNGEVLDYMEKTLRIWPRATIVDWLMRNECNHSTATYYLLLMRQKF
jgi:hypothetical protein